ncbi:MAG: nuclear transport factor 2 family protein [Betaproteobacteria bacterium]|jgi:ketosteroid isomerase-like protein
MSRSARLFHDVDEVIENWYACLLKCDLDSALSLWFEEDTVTCILPDGVRLTGHKQLRLGLQDLMKNSVMMDTLTATSHTYMGTTFVDSTEAVRFQKDSHEPSFFIHMTMILVQGTMGWRIAHLHTSQVSKDLIHSPSIAGDHGFH